MALGQNFSPSMMKYFALASSHLWVKRSGAANGTGIFGILTMSHSYEFDDDDAPWGDNVKGKQKNKRVKQRRRDTKRRYSDDNTEVDFYQNKSK
ncbi:hypothetical protein Sbal195_1414 [Shewanella baltica OS195]|uniref:Uncharacterized protein n=5 Tax=Shewanella TaxID=22 RepID=A9KUD9_SHEB9|nr:hypothetical protein Sbal195_1414 [Shewanella baltica OS195]ADT93624.1 hypothetical protein Sbal678_1449 [Shewanella baltica OS678]